MTWIGWVTRPETPSAAVTPSVPCPNCAPTFHALADNDAQLRDLNVRLYADLAAITRERDHLHARLDRMGVTP